MLQCNNNDDDNNNNNIKGQQHFYVCHLFYLPKLTYHYEVVNFMHLNFSYNNYKDMQYFLVLPPTITETALQN